MEPQGGCESGLYYQRARYYNPYIGRFVSEDSYWGEDKNPLSLNRYTYTHNNPIMFIDPTGHMGMSIGVEVGEASSDITSVGKTYTYQDIQVDEDNVEKIDEQRYENANISANAEVKPWYIDKNQVTTVIDINAAEVSLFADNGSDNLLRDGSDSGEGTHQFINNMSWIYNNYFNELKDLYNSGINKNSQEFENKRGRIIQDMQRVKNDVIDAQNNYAWAHPNSAYGKHILGDSGKSEEQVQTPAKEEDPVQIIKFDKLDEDTRRELVFLNDISPFCNIEQAYNILTFMKSNNGRISDDKLKEILGRSDIAKNSNAHVEMMYIASIETGQNLAQLQLEMSTERMEGAYNFVATYLVANHMSSLATKIFSYKKGRQSDSDILTEANQKNLKKDPNEGRPEPKPEPENGNKSDSLEGTITAGTVGGKSSIGTLIDDKVTITNKADLPKWIQDSYLNSKYDTVITNEEVTLYRVFGGTAEAGGGYASTKPTGSRIQAKVDAALLPEWGGTKMYEATIKVPKGTILNIGKVAPQTTKTGAVLNGGVDQILLPQGWSLDWIQSVRTVPSK